MPNSAVPTSPVESHGIGNGPQPIRVAVVEDDQGYRELLCLLFSKTPGFALAAAFGDISSALTGLIDSRADVFLMDIQLPEVSGIEGVRSILQRAPRMTVLMLTALEDHERVFGSLRAGAVGYLLKRCSPAEILEAIQDALAGGAPMSGSIARMVVKSFRGSAEPGGASDLLSPREHELLSCLAEGLRYKEIADRMDVSINTIRSYIRRVYEKLQVQSRTEALLKYREAP